ncbi:tRNA preQ1(34) S-adenosylmethionine ribosyltransferase-isomerase QueA [Yunchengibacter salinarum]|uniref:tRNA preQ1(34) S-adenosylmethionine ribosyltransferase-isomerase QueA n=1 Tax=Yunchengibacter salinarum TaxID=3133399 RepID=UPI0035B682D1
MDVDLFNFDLPEDRIALRPARPRDSAAMLIVRPREPLGDGGLLDAGVLDLPNQLQAGDCLVFNDTRVIPGRLKGRRGAARMEITLHKRESPTRWRVFARPAKKARPGDRLDFDGLSAEVLEAGEAGERLIRFLVDEADMGRALEQFGAMPLPPYIAAQRPEDAQDREDYQTLFAARDGAVAAPTAGLHFTPRLMDRIAARGLDVARLTLHVGAGTFLPVKASDTQDHHMHAEWGEVTPETAAHLNAVRARGGRIVAVGTTSLRLLETAADAAGTIHPFKGDTDIFITPGYRFRGIDALMTNFHLPKSTLFMLVSAFSGLDRMRAAYDHAVAMGYRFYSYGDACLLFPQEGAT